MKTALFRICVLPTLLIVNNCVRAGDLYQTFEPGEVTSSTWGSAWSSGTFGPAFLTPSLGGSQSGIGTSATQTYARSFSGNTVGISMSQPYYIGMYVQIDTTNGTPASGQFDIIDGSYGSAAADLHVQSSSTGLNWQAKDSGGNYNNLGITMTLSTPYWVMLAVNPVTKSYSATVDSVDIYGNILQSATLNNVASPDQNVFGNHGNGTLLFYLQTSAGAANVLVDNMQISSMPISLTPTPEPSTMALAAAGLMVVFYLKRLQCVT